MTKIPNYEIKIFWDVQMELFVCEVPELNGCTTIGKSYEEALNKIQYSIRRWIKNAKANNVPIPKPKGRLPLKNENICINCKRISSSSGRWKPSR